MKNKTALYFVVGVLALAAGLLWVLSATENEPDAQVFNATVNRDCAPWDGAAFTVSVPYDVISTITISIWQSPDIKFPVTFSFPDQPGRVGFAYSVSPLDLLEPLTGTMSFQRVQAGIPVEGRFELASETGREFKGRFTAEWGPLIAMCG